MDSKNILLLGAGHVGCAIALDLHKNGHRLKVIDNNPRNLKKLEKKGIDFLPGDFLNREFLKSHLPEQDLVIGAAPGHAGYKLIKEVIDAGKNMVDISFCPEDYLSLDAEAKKKKVTIVPDAGVAPGLCNLILGYHKTGMKINSYRCLVGGLPVKREWPLEYKASWSPVDVIEEYTRPARLRVEGKNTVRPALSDIEIVNIDPIGSLEEWNSDGLRSLLDTMPDIPNLCEKTLRYPGTTKYIRALSELGFFSTRVREVRGNRIRPVDLSTELLSDRWRMNENDREFTLMRVIIEGYEADKPVMYQYDLYDEYDEKTGTSSMARTTGYTCSAIASLILGGSYRESGVKPPEYLAGSENNFKFIIDYLESRNIKMKVVRKASE